MSTPSKSNFESLVKAAESGDVVAQYEVASCYFKGEFADKNYKKAYEFTQRAAVKGNPNAQHLLALYLC